MKIFQISHIWFSVCLAKNMKGCIRILYFVSDLYSQIWLNLPRIEHHFFLHCPMGDHHLGYNTKFCKIKLSLG